MKRREFITLIAGAAAWLSPWVRPVRAQNPPLPKAGAAGQAVASPAQVGLVATLKGSATVTRASATEAIALQINNPVFKNDILATGPNSSLGITFDDQTTFSLSANTRIEVNAFVYREGGNANAASINVAAGTAAFVASLVAKTGDMKITTPVATMGIRGTTGVIDVPEQGATAAPGPGGNGEPRVKLYADEDGHVGQIEVFGPQGLSLGTLTLAATAFAFRRGAGGRIEAVTYLIPPREAERDRGVLRRLLAAHRAGVRRTLERQRAHERHQQPRFNSRPPGQPPHQPRPPRSPRKPPPGHN
jgi:hypothetical protein